MSGAGGWLKSGRNPNTATYKAFEGLQGYQARARESSAIEVELVEGSASPSARERYDTKTISPIAGEVDDFIAVLREKSPNTARLEDLYALGDIGRKWLGLPARSRAVQITIIRNDAEPFESYTGVASRDLTDGIGTNTAVWVRLEARQAGDVIIWLVTALDALD